MNKNKTILIGCIAFPVILIIAFLIGFFSTKNSLGVSTKVPTEAWLHVNPTAMIADYSEIMPMKWFGSSMNSAEDMARKIRAAATDSRIKGLLIEPHYIQVNMPALGEIGKALEEFKKSGKPIVAYGEMMGQGDYLLATYAKEIYLEPSASAGLLLEGVSANVLFYKDLFAKLGIKMHVMQIGEFKGAGEPYSQNALSEGTRKNLEAVLADRYAILKGQISTRRKLTPEKVSELFEQRPDFFLSAAKAKEWGLIDYPMSRLDMLAKLNIKDEQLLKISAYKGDVPKTGKDKVAVVYLNGEITANTGNEFSDQATINSAKVERIIEDIRDDKAVKAIVLRINSPGGSALESEKIYQQLIKLKKDYPLVVSMGGVAASGGYYISCAGDYMMADNAAITGSIGVIMMIPETEGLGKKLGLNSQTLRFGKFAGAFNMFEKYDPALLQSLKESSEGTYTEFKNRVMTARKFEAAYLDSVAEGRVFSAEDAKANRLIDEIGDLQAAIAKAADLVNLKSYSVANFPQKISFLSLLQDSELFQMRQLLHFNFDPAKALEKELQNLPAAYEWQYLMPHKFEEYEERQF